MALSAIGGAGHVPPFDQAVGRTYVAHQGNPMAWLFRANQPDRTKHRRPPSRQLLLTNDVVAAAAVVSVMHSWHLQQLHRMLLVCCTRGRQGATSPPFCYFAHFSCTAAYLTVSGGSATTP